MTRVVVICRQSHVNDIVAIRPDVMDGSSTRNSERILSNNVVTVVVAAGGVAFVTDFAIVFAVPISIILLPLLVEAADENSDNE